MGMTRRRRPALALVLCLGLGAALAPGLVHIRSGVLAATTGSEYFATAPVRLLDTRLEGGPLAADGTRRLQVAGTFPVPSDATAVAINVTATDTTAASFLTVYPTGAAAPTTSNLNWPGGATVTNLAVAAVGQGGSVSFHNAAGSLELTVDLEGYFAPPGPAGTYFEPLTPRRIADTRPNSGYPGQGTSLGPQGDLQVQVAGEGGVPAGAVAAVLEVTATDTSATSYLAAYPSGAVWPGTSALNWARGDTVANRVIVTLGKGGAVALLNHSGTTDVIVDVTGYFTTSMGGPRAGLYYPLSPRRLIDTRTGGGALSPQETLRVQLGGVDGIAALASAVVLNLTATDTTTPGFFTVTPAPGMPVTSDLNWAPGQTVANADLAELGATGQLALYNASGSAAAIIDASGYFLPVNPTSGGQYTYWYRALGAVTWQQAATAAASHFLQAYVAPDGAVIRYDQGGDVVSEGQAYGMLIAELAGRPTVALEIWSWTKSHLLLPDGLLACHANADGSLLSQESATDADTLAAYALLRYQGAYAPALHAAGLAMATAVLQREAVTGPLGAPLPTAGPWANGPPTTLDPSYWMPGVYLALARYTGNQSWAEGAAQAISLITELSQNGSLLPTDWAELQGSSIVAIANPGGGAPVQYGLDAARIPVFLTASCAPRARPLAASWWQNYFARGGSEDSAIALTPTGGVINADTNPLPYLAAAAAAFAAGDSGAANQLLSQAQSEALQYPTYYGDAWMALGPALLEGLLAPC